MMTFSPLPSQSRFKLEELVEWVPPHLRLYMGEIIAAIRRGDREEQHFDLPQNFINNYTPPMAPPFTVPQQPANNFTVLPLASAAGLPPPAALNGATVPQQMYPAPLVSHTAVSGINPTGNMVPPPAYAAPVSQASVATGGVNAPLSEVPRDTPALPQEIKVTSPPTQDSVVGSAGEVNRGGELRNETQRSLTNSLTIKGSDGSVVAEP